MQYNYFMKKILFVCLGNICRSPAAEGFFIKFLNDHQLSDKFNVESRGTSGQHAGEWPDPRMINAARDRGIELPSKSQKLTSSDLEKFDYILCMDKKNIENVLNLPNAEFFSDKIKLFGSYGKKLTFLEVPDPYWGNADDFNLVLDIVTDASYGFLLSEFHIDLLKKG
jgi:protein-tyrosine phosphatase